MQNISANDELNIIINPSLGNYSGKLSERTYLSSIHHMGNMPTSVYKNGTLLSERNSYGELRNNTEGYYYDNIRRILYVQIKANTDSLYQIKAEGIALNISDETEINPEEFVLYQNYPNPFNPTTKIKYTIPTPPISSPLSKGRTKEGFVTLKVYDILGNEIATLVNEEKPGGTYEVEFNSHSGEGRNLTSGVYFYQLKAGDFIDTKKMILLK